MNTTMNMQSQIYDARKALGGYLERTDLLLARSGLSRSERDETLGQIAEQFYDLLGVPVGEADRELTENAIAKLAPETAFELDDATTLRQHIRAAWPRLMIGQPVPVFLNDHGRKRVVWNELIKRMAWLSFFGVVLYTITTAMMLGIPSWRWITNGLMFGCMQLGLWFGFYRLYHRTPVEAMPRAKDWSDARLDQHRFAWMLAASGIFLFFIALFPMTYWLTSAILSRPPWPVDTGLFLIVSVVLGALLFLFSMWEAWRRRRNTRRFNNWDRWIATDTGPVDQGQPC